MRSVLLVPAIVIFLATMLGLVAFLGYDLSRSSDVSVGELSGQEIPPPEYARVAEVRDAMTITLEGGQVVRYLGVRTPSAAATVQCFAKEALQANESLLGMVVRLEEDPVLTRAQDGTWVRYLWAPGDEAARAAYAAALDGTPVSTSIKPSTGVSSDSFSVPGELFDHDATDEAAGEEGADRTGGALEEYLVNERMIERGLGFPLLSTQMVHFGRLSAAARFSRATKKGLWGACEVSDQAGRLETNDTNDCTIKGELLADGSRVYRLPGCRAYGDTVVLLYQGDAWFCREEEAQAAGFQKGRDCL